jgi:hypothetical protein
MRSLSYNDIAADRNVVAVVQALEALLQAQAGGHPGGVVKVNGPDGGLALYHPGVQTPNVLYTSRV